MDYDKLLVIYDMYIPDDNGLEIDNECPTAKAIRRECRAQVIKHWLFTGYAPIMWERSKAD